LEPLEVVFHLRTPIALGLPWIFFDSLLMHAKLKEELGEKYYLLPAKAPIKDLPQTPIRYWRDVPVASVSLIEPEPQPSVFSFFKRGDFPFPAGRIRRGSGFFKDFYLKAAYTPARGVKFYCTGEAQEVLRLCRMIPALGKERNIGFGFIKSVEVHEVEREWGLVRDGLAMRPIPVRYLARYEDAAYLAYKPPYWAKQNIDLCCVPFTRCELLDRGG
jgi:hypothetical protein